MPHKICQPTIDIVSQVHLSDHVVISCFSQCPLSPALVWPSCSLGLATLAAVREVSFLHLGLPLLLSCFLTMWYSAFLGLVLNFTGAHLQLR